MKSLNKVLVKTLMAALLTCAGIAHASAAPLKPIAPVQSCASLMQLSADAIAETKLHILSATIEKGAHSYCSVKGVVAPEIQFEVRLPKRWTQRLLQTGCGGLCGVLSIRTDHDGGCTPVTHGNIVLASTNMGHEGTMMGDGSFGSDPQKRIDFAHRGVHLTNLIAKALIKAYYGRPQKYAYFSGCSDGGREALMEAQRYPNDFNGIAAGAPALNFTLQNSFYHAWMAKSNMDAQGHALISAVDLPVLHSLVLEQCDALDGLKDGQITDPRQCHVRLEAALCSADYMPGKCLTAAQIDAARKLYAGARDALGKPLVLGSVMPGSELAWKGVFVTNEKTDRIGSEGMALGTINNLLFTPNPATPYSVQNWPFTAEMLAQLEPARKLYSADNADLSGFAAHGGKLLLWHGWSDPHISPKNTLDYYHRVGLKMGEAARGKFVKLFLLPGMYHCGGGDGPSEFPLLAALMNWVENGHAPNQLIAHRVAARPMGSPHPTAKPFQPAAFTPRSRPVYAYPQIAKYKGKGSLDNAVNFVPFTPKPDAETYDWPGAK
jgi:Tannase and feruloyl esterase